MRWPANTIQSATTPLPPLAQGLSARADEKTRNVEMRLLCAPVMRACDARP
jgi:hypothetical protein